MLSATQKTSAIGMFKDWTNYLLVTTVAAVGWVASQPPSLLTAACVSSFALSIIFAIFTLAIIPTVAEQLQDDQKSIYEIDAAYKLFWLWGPELTARLKYFCWPQHVFFLLGIVLYAGRAVLRVEGPVL